MKKVYQTIIEKGNGNCMQAAMASLLELPLEEVPHFKENKEWFEVMWKFLKEHDYEFKGTIYNSNHSQDEHHLFERIKEDDGVNGFFFATVYSPKFYNPDDENPITHAVIINKDFEIVHDPNPNNKGLKRYPTADEIGYNGILNYFLIEKYNEDEN